MAPINQTEGQEVTHRTRTHLVKRGILAIQFLLSILLLVLIFRDFDVTAFSVTLQKASWWFVGALIITILLQFLYVLKWDILLKSMGFQIPYLTLVRQTFVGFFFANFAPASIGQDAAKVYYLGKQNGYLNMTASVLIDKVLGLFSMTVLATVLLWGLNLSTPLFNTTRHILTGVLLVFIVALLIAHIPWEKFLNFFSHHPSIAFLADQTEKLLTYMRTAGSSPFILAISVAILAVIFTINTLVYLEFFSITVQRDLGFFQTMAVILTITIITNLPISVNGIGVREQTHFLYFAALGIPKEATVGIAVLIFAQSVILSLIGYGLWVSRKKFEKITVVES